MSNDTELVDGVKKILAEDAGHPVDTVYGCVTCGVMSWGVIKCKCGADIVEFDDKNIVTVMRRAVQGKSIIVNDRMFLSKAKLAKTIGVAKFNLDKLLSEWRVEAKFNNLPFMFEPVQVNGTDGYMVDPDSSVTFEQLLLKRRTKSN
jgi:hypothetical protein